MSGKDRLAVFPSRGVQMAIKGRLKSAENGHSLLKKKSKALQMRIIIIANQIVKTKVHMGDIMKKAAFTLTKAKFIMGNFDQDIIQNASKAQIKILSRKENVAGVALPVFEVLHDGKDSYELIGLARGGQQIVEVKSVYNEAVLVLIELASLQSSFLTVEQVITSVRHRVNAIEHVIIPKIERTIVYIVAELDERDREDFYRMKKVQNNKRRAKELKEKQLKLDQEKQEELNKTETEKE